MARGQSGASSHGRRGRLRARQNEVLATVPEPANHPLLTLQKLAGNRATSTVVEGDGAVIQRALSSPRFDNDPVLADVDAGTRVLEEGDSGEHVRKVQHAIHDYGIRFALYGSDGKYGTETARRVRQFQSQERVAGGPDGDVGTDTIHALDVLFPAVALPTTAGDPYTFTDTLQILCQWNEAMVKDLRNLHVTMVDTLEWPDERFDGSGWVANPMQGAGETAGTRITIATDGNTNEDVAKTLYHEYQHARAPFAYRSKSWADEEQRVFEMETFWAIDRGLTPDPGLTTTDPNTGEVEIDPGGVKKTVESYPGLDAAQPGEVFQKVRASDVRVRLPDGRVIVRPAVSGDTIPRPRQVTNPRRILPADWRCP